MCVWGGGGGAFYCCFVLHFALLLLLGSPTPSPLHFFFFFFLRRDQFTCTSSILYGQYRSTVPERTCGGRAFPDELRVSSFP